MTKPKLLFLTGIGWSATNPLYKTLRENKIIISGACKEPNTLHWLSSKDPNFWYYKRDPQYKWLLENKTGYKLENIQVYAD